MGDNMPKRASRETYKYGNTNEYGIVVRWKNPERGRSKVSEFYYDDESYRDRQKRIFSKRSDVEKVESVSRKKK